MLGKEGKPSHVIRMHAPARRIIFITAVALLALFALYVVYELGRYNAGYDRLAVQQERTEQEVAMEHLEKTNHQLRTQLAKLDTISVGRAREQAEVARGIGDLQSQVARQSQELAFYRGVVAQGASELGVKIGQVRIASGAKPGEFMVHFSLVRAGRPDSVVTGILGLTVDGASAGKPAATLDLAALTPAKPQRELPFNFRFYENFDQEIVIPAGFKPEHLAVEVRSSRKDVAPLVQTFLWSLEASH